LKKLRIIEIFSYPLVGLIYTISWLPLALLYKLSWLVFLLLYYIPGYRKNVVYRNLANAFPEKSPVELLSIRRKFYRHLSCLIVEVIKLLSFSTKELNRRCIYTPEAKELINSYLQNKRSIMIVMGHYGNWEWTGTSFYSTFGIYPVTAYRPVKNRVIDSLIKRLRKRFGVKVNPMRDFSRQMFLLRNQTNAVILIADQTPSKLNAHWVRFLNQDTPVFKGTSRLTRMFNYPLIFCCPRPAKKGYYVIHAELITSTPKKYDEQTLSSLHTQMLEKEIKRAPEYWLWSHKRWKHKRL